MIGVVNGRGRMLPVVADGAGPVYAANPDAGKPVFGLLGDSITAGNKPTNNGDINRGYWQWAQSMSGFRAYCAAYAGVGGNITTQMLARLDADVITPLSASQYDGRDKFCAVMGGVNDSTNVANIIATATSNLAAIYTALLNAGITPIAMTITPTSSCVSAQQIANWNGINAWLLSYCPANGITLCNNIADCLGQSYPATTSPIWKAGYTHDGVHPTARGAQAIAAALAATLETLLDPVDHFQASTAQFVGRILSNHAMLGSGGTLTDGASGAAADSWELFYGAGSKEVRSDGKAGEWQVMAITGASTRIGPDPTIDVVNGFRPGDLVVAQAEVVCVDDWLDISQFVLVLEFRQGATVLKGLSFLGNDPYTGIMINPAPGEIITLRTVPTIVPAGTNIIRTYINLVGAGGSIRIGRYELMKLAQ